MAKISKVVKSPLKKEVPKETKKPAPTKSKQSPELRKLVESLNKKFGVNAVVMGFPHNIGKELFSLVERIPTGSVALDIALGGGLPLGRFIELSGAYSSTKTSQCAHIVREAQKAGLVCAWLDIEGTSDEAYFKSFGIDTDLLLYSRPDGTEEATQLLLDYQRSGEVHLAVLDSFAAMSPNKEQESDMDGTIRMGVQQQLLGEYFRKYQANNNRLSREGKKTFTLLGINQLREKIGAYGDWLVA